MLYRLGDPVWAYSDGSNVARGWHRGKITATRRDGAHVVELVEYGREFRTFERGLRPRNGSNDINLPTTWSSVPFFRPDPKWKRRESTHG